MIIDVNRFPVLCSYQINRKAVQRLPLIVPINTTFPLGTHTACHTECCSLIAPTSCLTSGLWIIECGIIGCLIRTTHIPYYVIGITTEHNDIRSIRFPYPDVKLSSQTHNTPTHNDGLITYGIHDLLGFRFATSTRPCSRWQLYKRAIASITACCVCDAIYNNITGRCCLPLSNGGSVYVMYIHFWGEQTQFDYCDANVLRAPPTSCGYSTVREILNDTLCGDKFGTADHIDSVELNGKQIHLQFSSGQFMVDVSGFVSG